MATPASRREWQRKGKRNSTAITAFLLRIPAIGIFKPACNKAFLMVWDRSERMTAQSSVTS